MERYQKVFAIPEGFPSLLKGFVREVLREQPSDLLAFGASHFAALRDAGDARDGAAAGGHPQGAPPPQGHVSALTHEELEEVVVDLFRRFDADGSGALDRHEFKACLQDAGLGLRKRDVNRIMAQVDADDDGVVSYAEFMPLAVEVLASRQAADDALTEQHERERAATARAEAALARALPEDHLDAELRRAFSRADVDGNGVLSRAEFRAALGLARLGLTKRDMNLVLAEADVDGDGNISYGEFCPVARRALVERLSLDLLAEDAWQSEDALTQALLDGFAAWDASGAGELPVSEVRAALVDMSAEWLGLSRLQLAAVMALPQAAPAADTHLVNYARLAVPAAAVVADTMGMRNVTNRAVAVSALADGAEMRWLAGADPAAAAAELAEAFEACDVDGTGRLPFDKAVELVQALGGGDEVEGGLADWQVRAILGAADADGDGTVDWSEFAAFVGDVLGHLAAEEQTLRECSVYQEEW